MDGQTSKKDFFYVVVLILTFITVVIGMAFAIYTWIFSQKEGTSAVYTGTLSVQYFSGKSIDVNSLYPMETPNYDSTVNVYRNAFRVANVGSLDGIIQINMDISVNEFSNDTLKYILYNSSGDIITEGFVNGKGSITIASNVLLAGGASENYVLIIWLNENNKVQNTEMRKSLTGIISVDATQQKD